MSFSNANDGQALMATKLTYSVTVTVVKFSILLLYRRLFVTRSFKLLTVVVASLCMAWFTAAAIADVFQCRPVSAAFDASQVFTDKCIDLKAYWWSVTSTNMVSDLSPFASALAPVAPFVATSDFDTGFGRPLLGIGFE